MHPSGEFPAPAWIGPLRGIALADESDYLLPYFFGQERYQARAFSFRRLNQLTEGRRTHLTRRKSFPIRSARFDEVRKLSILSGHIRLV
jgi:hypothetical protein